MAFQRKKPAAIGVKAVMPDFIEPALATSIEKVPSGARWLHEIKFDGYRVQVHLRDAAVKVFTRRGNDWTNRFKKIASDAWHVSAGSAIIDGEVVAPAEDGTTDFSVLQNELQTAAGRAKGAAQEVGRWHRHSVQRQLRGRRPRDVCPHLQSGAGGCRLQSQGQPLRFWAWQRLGQEDMRPARN
jgi:hypothetical protein